MAEKPNAPAAQGATPEDVSEHYSTQGNPAPAAPPNKKPPEPVKPEDEEKPVKDDDGKETPPSVEQDDEDDGNEPDNFAELDTEVWGSTDNDAGDSVLTVLQNSGIDPADAKAIMYDALLEGKPENIDLAALEEKVGPASANLIMIGVRQYLSDAQAKAEAIDTIVFEAAGSKENWDKVTTWARETVDEADLAEYRAMLDKGGVQAKLAAQDLLGKYNAAETNTTLGGTPELTGDAVTVASARTLSKQDYYTEISAAHARGASPAEIQEIKDARARGRAKGK